MIERKLKNKITNRIPPTTEDFGVFVNKIADITDIKFNDWEKFKMSYCPCTMNKKRSLDYVYYKKGQGIIQK